MPHPRPHLCHEKRRAARAFMVSLVSAHRTDPRHLITLPQSRWCQELLMKVKGVAVHCRSPPFFSRHPLFSETFSLICKCYIQSLFCLASFAETLKNTTRAQTRLASLGMCKEHPCPAIQPAYVKAHPSSHLWKVYLNI